MSADEPVVSEITTDLADLAEVPLSDVAEAVTAGDANPEETLPTGRAGRRDAVAGGGIVQLGHLIEPAHTGPVNDRTPAKRKPIEIGTGMPATSHLEAFGQCLRDAFGAMPYHVGSSIHGKEWRDVDVRIMLDDDRFDVLFPGYADYGQRDAWWSLLCSAISELGRQRTGLPIDFQVQKVSEANEKFPGPRNPLFVGHAKEEHRPAVIVTAENGGAA